MYLCLRVDVHSGTRTQYCSLQVFYKKEFLIYVNFQLYVNV
ncbi:unnamed protein product [Schistosoma curassoni]|uniref:Uncharacterized protein n=1 Tax=Schistosoma curassoni TaxID=6186 RepID=A0A183KKQ0_9TREM|nr:unnamed protein product [Schistosoma curassoni]